MGKREKAAADYKESLRLRAATSASFTRLTLSGSTTLTLNAATNSGRDVVATQDGDSNIVLYGYTAVSTADSLWGQADFWPSAYTHLAYPEFRKKLQVSPAQVEKLRAIVAKQRADEQKEWAAAEEPASKPPANRAK